MAQFNAESDVAAWFKHKASFGLFLFLFARSEQFHMAVCATAVL
jgi:hypothetical protein